MCLNVNCASPPSWLAGSRRIKSRASRIPSASSMSSIPATASSTPRQKVLPMIAAARTALRAFGGIASIRAAIASRTVTGSSPLSPSSSTDAASSSRKSGLPPATSTRRSRSKERSPPTARVAQPAHPPRPAVTDRAGSSSARRARFPRSGACRAAPAARRRRSSLATRARAVRGTRAERSRCSAPSGCPRRRRRWAARRRRIR